jgi:hypothetical protein
MDPLIKTHCFFPPTLALREAMEEKEKKQAEIKQLLPGVFIPPQELAACEGPVLEAELKWAKYLQHLENKKEADLSLGLDTVDRSIDAKTVLDLLQSWRMQQATQLALAPASVLSDLLIKKLAYAATHHQITKSLMDALGVRLGDKDDLIEKLSAWRRDVWGVEEEGGSEGTLLTISDAWRKLHYGQPCSSAPRTLNASQKESIAWFARGSTVEAIAMSKQPKAVLPDTIINHLMDGLHCGDSLILSVLPRLFELLPTLEQCEQVSAAFEATGSDWRDLKAPLKPICDALGGDSVWYHRIRVYSVLMHLKYPFTFTTNRKSGSQPQLKKARN